MILTNQQQHALALLENGWTVREVQGQVEWRSPRGISGMAYISAGLDDPPDAAIEDALNHQDYYAGKVKGVSR